MMTILPLIILMFITIYVLIGVYVYRDARQRGMNALLWTVVVILVPSFLGLVIYLLVRNGESFGSLCYNCKRPIKDEFEVCPYCSVELVEKCEGCGKKVSKQWKICPWCRHELINCIEKEMVKGIGSRKKSKLITAIVLLIIIIFTGFMALFIIRSVGTSKEFYFMAYENNTNNHCFKRYEYFDGTSTRNFSLKKGQTITIKIDSVVKKGKLNIEIDNSKAEVVKYIKGGSSEIAAITADRDENYKIKAIGIKTKGSFDISWDKSGP